MNRWTFLSVLAVVAGAVGGFAVYTFGWNDESDDGERARARAYAEQIACYERDPSKQPCRTVNAVERVGPGLWRVDVGMSDRICVQVDLDEFEFTSDGVFKGIGPGACSVG